MSCCKQKSAIFILKNTDPDSLYKAFEYSRDEIEIYVKIANESGKFKIFEGTIDECTQKSLILSNYKIAHQCTLL